MGCDIHLHVEIKINNEWLHYSHPKLNRNYGLFGKMAGVRGSEKPISEPKGLPKDITKTTKFCSDEMGFDGHSHSWLSSWEVTKLMAFIETKMNCLTFEHEQLGYLFGNGYGGFNEYKEEYPKELQDFRFVFWFDN